MKTELISMRRQQWYYEFVISIEMLRDGAAASAAFDLQRVAPAGCIDPLLGRVYVLHAGSRFMRDRQEEAAHDLHRRMVRFLVYGTAIRGD